MSYSGALQEPARWTYDTDPATGNSRATYPGEVIVAGSPVGGPVTGTGAQVLQNAPTINNPTIASGTFTGTIAGGATYTAPTLTNPTITGTVAGGATYTAPTLANPTTTGVLTAGAGGATQFPIVFSSNQPVLPVANFAATLGFNFSAGAGEADFVNLYPSASVSFEFYQMNAGGTAANLLATLFPNGTLQLLSGLLGVTNGSNAPAGVVGEYLSATRLVGTAVPLTNNTSADILALSLTAGDWDVAGNIAYQGAGGTIQIGATGWISIVSATLPPLPNNGGETIITGIAPAANQTICIPISPQRISVAATTIVYLSTNTAFGSGTLVGYGFIGARRAR